MPPTTAGRYQQRLKPRRPSYIDRVCMRSLQDVLPWPCAAPGMMSSRYLAALAGIAQSRASMHLTRLEYLGMIECVKPRRQGSKVPGLYRLTKLGLRFDPQV